MGTSLKSKAIFVLAGCILIGFFPGSANKEFAWPDLNDVGRETGVRHLVAENLQGGWNERIELDPGRTSSLRFAVIGDYGDNSQAEADVAELIKSWAPDIVLTTGDNNYNDGAAETIDENIGKYYSEFIFPYTGIYGDGAQVNRFFPSLGNHDWDTIDPVDKVPSPYLDYFDLPGNERYYDFTWGAVHFFIVDSDPHEPDGYEDDSIQANWLQTQLANSIHPWKIVVMHHPPYSSGDRGSSTWMRWPFAQWGADVVLAAHDHTYERISPPGDILYFVNGLGGKSIYGFADILEGSQIRYNGGFGAMRVDVFSRKIRFQFINRQGEVIDDFSLVKQFEIEYLPLVRKTSP